MSYFFVKYLTHYSSTSAGLSSGRRDSLGDYTKRAGLPQLNQYYGM